MKYQKENMNIGPFPFSLRRRERKKVNFSLPILFEKVIIVHKPVLMSNNTNIILNYFLKNSSSIYANNYYIGTFIR